MNLELIPQPDPTPLPGPAWLFHLLLVVTFVFHLIFMNVALGGSLLAAVAHLTRRGSDGVRDEFARRLTRANTYAISLAITTGVAPLLFVQVLFQQYFYPATILIARGWLSLVLLLLVGYYATYLYKYRGLPARGEGGGVFAVVAAASFLGIAMLQVTVNLVHSQPDEWARIADRPWSVVTSPVFVVRVLHFVLAAVAFTALLAAWWAARAAERGEAPPLNAAIARYGMRWALWSTAAQVADGFLLLVLLPPGTLTRLMRSGAAAMVPLAASVMLAFGTIAMLARVTEPVGQRGLLGGALGAMTLTVAVMAVTRHQVRLAYLQPATSRFTLAEAPQWGNFFLFAVLLAGGLGLLGWMLRAVAMERRNAAG